MNGIFYCDLSEEDKKKAEDSSKLHGVKARGGATFESSLLLLGPKANLEWLKEDSFEESALRPVDSIAEDLLAVAVHVNQADILVPRPENSWFREMELHIGVHDKGLWTGQETALADMLSEITHDRFRINFYSLPPNRTRPKLLMPFARPTNSGICVFSSHFVPVFGIAKESTTDDLVASVRYDAWSFKERQQRILKQIWQVGNKVPYFAFRIRSKANAAEGTQRTSAFLQLALAAALAHSTGASRIRLFGDCISSYHLSERQFCGPGYSVHDTRPDFLRQSLNILQALSVLPTGVQLENPYQFSTAVDVLKNWAPKKKQILKRLLDETDSCLEKSLAKKLTNKSWGERAPHCGCCFPCKMRRLAALGAGLESTDNLTAYAINPLRPISKTQLRKLGPNLQERVEQYHQNGLPDLKEYLKAFEKKPLVANLQQKINYLKATEFLLTAAEPFPRTGPTASEQHADMIIEVHKRFWNQIGKYL